MKNCKNKVDKYVVRGWSYIKDIVPCGTTDEEGKVLLCDACLEQESLKQIKRRKFNVKN